MVVDVKFNGDSVAIATPEDLGVALDRFDLEHRFELWVSVEVAHNAGRARD